VLKPYIAQRQAQAVARDHALHGIDAHTNHVKESGEQPVTGRRARESASKGSWQAPSDVCRAMRWLPSSIRLFRST
jgi:hypothetical protein